MPGRAAIAARSPPGMSPPGARSGRSEAIHYLQHLTLLITALLLWTSLLPRRAEMKVGLVAAFSLFATSMHSTLLGALLTLSPTVWYASYTASSGSADMSALEDQQLAGLIMWVPAGLVYLAAALALLGAVLRDDAPPARRGRGLPVAGPGRRRASPNSGVAGQVLSSGGAAPDPEFR